MVLCESDPASPWLKLLVVGEVKGSRVALGKFNLSLKRKSGGESWGSE